jgi:hypothetical protein
MRWSVLNLFGIRDLFKARFFETRESKQRKLDAAIALVDRMLPSDQQATQSNGSMPASNIFMTGVQIRSLFELLDEDLKEMLLESGSPFKTVVVDSGYVDRRPFDDALKALQALLESKRIAFLGRAKESRASGLLGTSAATRAAVVAAGDENKQGTTPVNEASLLWGATEKFYASTQVRLILVVLGIAVALAATGSAVIGGQTLNIRQSLESLSEATQNKISTVSDALIKDLRDKKQDVDSQLRDAKQEVAELRSGSQKIKTDIITTLQQGLKDQESSLRDEVLKPILKIRNVDLEQITKDLGTATRDVADVDAKARNQSDKLNRLGSTLDMLSTYADKSKTLGSALSTIEKDGEAALNSRRAAETEANTAALKRAVAEAAAVEAANQRERVIELIKQVNKEVVDHIRASGAAENQLKALVGGLSSIDGRLKDDETKQTAFDERQKTFENRQKKSDEKQKAAEARLGSLEDQLAKEETRLKSIQERVAAFDPPKPPPAKGLRSVDSLTQADWTKIQSKLGMKGKNLDGLFGDRTRSAVEAYQRRKKAELTGQLTPEQIEDLLGPAKP